MKKNLTLMLMMLTLTTWTFAQSAAKRYILLEHFTNSRCSICGSQNPGFYSTIANYSEDVHHISYHPPIPYNNCVFYLSNPNENSTRASYYNVNGTPRVLRNGVNASSAAQVTSAVLNGLLGQTSPLQVVVSETSGAQRTATIEARSIGVVPDGNYKLYVAVVERQVQYAAPNGEQVHHNVFRKMLTNINGDVFNPAIANQSVTLTFNYTVDSDWEQAEVYVLAFVQNTQSKEILNSGTRFDAVVLDTNDPLDINVRLYPNPTSNVLFLKSDEPLHGRLAINNAAGALIYNLQLDGQTELETPVSQLPSGLYWVSILTDKGRRVEKILKQ